MFIWARAITDQVWSNLGTFVRRALLKALWAFWSICFQPVHEVAASARDPVKSYCSREMGLGKLASRWKVQVLCPSLSTTVFRFPPNSASASWKHKSRSRKHLKSASCKVALQDIFAVLAIECGIRGS